MVVCAIYAENTICSRCIKDSWVAPIVIELNETVANIGCEEEKSKTLRD